MQIRTTYGHISRASYMYINKYRLVQLVHRLTMLCYQYSSALEQPRFYNNVHLLVHTSSVPFQLTYFEPLYKSQTRRLLVIVLLKMQPCLQTQSSVSLYKKDLPILLCTSVPLPKQETIISNKQLTSLFLTRVVYPITQSFNSCNKQQWPIA